MEVSYYESQVEVSEPKVNVSEPKTEYPVLDSENEVKAYCLEEGWTVIQSRGQFGNAKDHFVKQWDDYVQGFGEPGLYSVYHIEMVVTKWS